MRLITVSIVSFLMAALSSHAFGAACTSGVGGGPSVPTNGYFILAEGDSITAGQGASDGLGSYVDRAANSIKFPKTIVVHAKSQSVLGWPAANSPSNSVFNRMEEDNALVPADKQGKIYILSLLIGRNDLVGYYGGMDQYLTMLSEYASRMRKAGWDRIVLGSLPPSNWDLFGPVRAEFNKRIVEDCWYQQHGFDSIVDFAAMNEMGADSAARDERYFVDGTHPSNHGYQLMSEVYAKAINALGSAP